MLLKKYIYMDLECEWKRNNNINKKEKEILVNRAAF